MEQQTPPTEPVEESIFTEDDYSMEGYDKHVRHARVTLYVVAVLMVLSLFLLPRMADTARKIAIGFVVFLAAVFAVLGYWSTKKPFTAILTGLIVYIALQVADAIADPSTLLRGWYVKIGVTLFLIMGLRNAKEIQDRRKAFGK
jgi:peptidoglycan/LPS O-acetylase OafA/YrhL